MALNIPISLNIENLAEVTAQVAKMTGAAGGAGAGGAAKGPGAIGSLFGGEGGAGGSTAKGLGQIAKQLPGAGVLGDMGSAFKQGGIIGVGMAGVAGILGFVKQIVESSKVFQGIAGSFFKIFGAMADLFLLPFLPLAMRGMQMLMQHLPKFQEWGQKTADWIQGFISDIQSGGFWKTIGDLINDIMPRFEVWMVGTGIPALGLAIRTATTEIGKNVIMSRREKTDEFGVGTGEFENDYMETIKRWGKIAERLNPMTPSSEQKGMLTQWVRGKLGWGQGEQEGQQFSPTIKRGDQVGALGGIEEGIGGIMNSMEVSLARQAEKVKNYASEFQQKEVGAGGMLGVWDDEVLRGSIPDTWDSISGMYRKMNDELEDEARNAKDLGGDIKFPDLKELKLGDMGLGKIVDQLGAALNMMTLSDFVLDPSVAKEIDNCFIITNQCINTKWKSLADLVESGVEAVQFGVGGQVMDLDAINNLVTSAQGMGGAVAAEANAIAAEVAKMVQQMADPNLDLTVDPAALSQRIIELQKAVGGKVTDTANKIIGATATVNSIVDSWNQIGTFESMDEGLFYQFGGLGAAFGEATSNANAAFNKIKNRRFKRRSQVKKGGAGATGTTGDGDGGDGDGGAGDGGAGDTTGKPPGTGQPFEYERTYPDVTVVHVPDVARPAQVDAPLVFEKAEFEAAWGVGETEVREIAGTDQWSGEEAIDIFNDYAASVQAVVNDKSITPQYDDYSDEWWQFGGHGAGGGGGGRRGVQNMSHSVMNISINTKSSVQDILSDLKRIQYMDDASFFNSVS